MSSGSEALLYFSVGPKKSKAQQKKLNEREPHNGPSDRVVAEFVRAKAKGTMRLSCARPRCCHTSRVGRYSQYSERAAKEETRTKRFESSKGRQTRPFSAHRTETADVSCLSRLTSSANSANWTRSTAAPETEPLRPSFQLCFSQQRGEDRPLAVSVASSLAVYSHVKAAQLGERERFSSRFSLL